MKAMRDRAVRWPCGAPQWAQTSPVAAAQTHPSAWHSRSEPIARSL